jgi:DNA ligase-1
VERKAKINVDKGVFSQPKLDGIRAAAAPGELKTREGEQFVTPTKIMNRLHDFHAVYPTIVLDGELYNHALRNDFEKISSLIRKTKPTDADIDEANALVEYHVYDMKDLDHPHLKFSERQAILKEILTGFDDSIILVKTSLVHSEDEIDSLYGEYLEDQYEGQMIRIDEPYQMKRSKTLLKRKEFEDAEFEIDYVEEGVGNWAGAVKIAHIFLEDGRQQKSGVAGSFDFLASLLEDADSLRGTEVTVRFQGRTGDGKLRFPVVKKFWRGKRDV